MTCVLCGHKCGDHADMQTHLAKHSLNPPRVFKVPRHRVERLSSAGVLELQTTSGAGVLEPRQARQRSRNPSPKRRAQHEPRQRRSSAHRSTASTVTIPPAIYEVAKLMADSRTRRAGSAGIHVDSIAADLSTSHRFRELSLRRGSQLAGINMSLHLP